MPVLKIKNNGVWEEVAGVSNHTHTSSDIIDFPVSLPADGGNADTLDGKHADEFVLATGLATVAISGDYNDLINKPELFESNPELPEVTADDNGKVLGVADGIWQKITVSDSGSGVTSWNDLEDKPFYEYEGRVDVLKLKTHSGFTFDSTYGTYVAFEQRSCDLIIGETYIVHWDGSEYECVAQDASAIASGAVLLGNATNFGLSGNNEPFIIACMAGIGTQYFALTDTTDGGSHIIGIDKEAILVHQIDKKYVPIPFFGEESETILDCAFIDTKDDTDNWSLQCMHADSSDSTLVVGNIYTVLWNGVSYECECIEVFGLPAVGNTVVIGGENNGMPFAIARDINGGVLGAAGWMAQIIAPNDDGVYNCTIYGNAIKKVDTKYLYQPDWNENNKARGSYIANRPFYSLDSGTIVLPETTASCSIQESETEYIGIINKIDIMPVMYEVEFDGTIYSTNGLVTSTQSLIECSDDNNETVCMIINTEGFTAVLATQGEHTLKITLAEDVIQKIDPKYLPDIDVIPEVSVENNGQVMTVVDGVWAVQAPAIGLPEVTASDSGKFLRVSSAGIWVAEIISNAEEVSF